MKPFSEALRYEYPLTPDSVIIEAGTHRGLWAEAMAKRYGCTIHTFEPIFQFWRAAKDRLYVYPNVHVHNVGLSDSLRTETWKIKGDMTGAFNGEGEEQDVTLIDFCNWLDRHGEVPDSIDLLEINIEGGEYALLEDIFRRGYQSRFRNIQVQPHGVVPNAVERWTAIQQHLSVTHELTYCAPFCWENWQLKS